MIQVFIFIRKKEKKLKNETAHLRKSLFCSESFDQASLHAAYLLQRFLGVLDPLPLHSFPSILYFHINTEHF